MSAIQQRKPYSPPTLGLNTRYDARTLNDQEASTLINYQVNNSGILEKYPGYTLDASPFPANALCFIRIAYNFRRGATVNQLLVGAYDTGNANATYNVDLKYTIGDSVYKYLTFGIGTATFTNGNTAVTGTNTNWTSELKAGDKIKLASDPDSDYTEIASVNSNTSITLVAGGYLGTTAGSPAAYLARKIWANTGQLRMITFNNVAIVIDGNGLPQHYDGTNIYNILTTYSGTTPTTQTNAAPAAYYLEVHKNRVFMADQAGNLYWSHAGDETFWDPTSTEAISPEDGGIIVGIKSFADSLFVFKNNGFVYRVFGNFDDSAIGTVQFIRRVDYTDKIGLISSKSITTHNNYLYFVAQTGLYAIDFRGYMQKVSWNIDPTVAAFNFGNGASQAKSYNFSTTQQWNTGTHKGTYSTPSNQLLTSFFDDYRITDALQQKNLCSVAIGNDNTVYVAYVPQATPSQINFVRYRPGGTTLNGSAIRTENSILVDVTHGNVDGLSIAVSNADGTVGVAYWGSANKGLYYIERSPDTQSPFAYGTWGNASNDQVQGVRNPSSMNLIFDSGGTPYIGSTASSPSTSHVVFYTRSAGVWSMVDGLDSGATSVSDFTYNRNAIAIDNSNNLYLAVQFNGFSTIYVYKSVNGGASWSTIDSFTTTSGNWDPRAPISVGFNHAGHFMVVCSDTGGHIIKRDTNTTTSTTITTVSGYCGGWFPVYNNLDSINVDTDNYYYLTGSPLQESMTSNHNTGASIGTTIQNSTTNVINNPTDGSLHPSMQPFIPSNGTTPGQTVAFINFGSNANEIVIRRVCFYGYWQGPQDTDSTLTAWGTYTVTGQTGLSFTFEVALSSSNPATSFSTIVPGSIISSNSTLVYVIPRIEFTCSNWNGGTVTSLTLNYTGAGVDPKQVFGLSFFNELYLAACQPGQSANNVVLEQDIKDVFLTTSYPVNCMDYFSNKIYAGSSLQGDVYILKNGYSFNGTAYTATFISKEDFLNILELEKEFFKVYVLYSLPNGGSFTFSYRIDNFVTGNAPWTSVTVPSTTTGGNNPNGIQEVEVFGSGRSIQFMVQDSTANQYSAVIGYVLIWGTKDIR